MATFFDRHFTLCLMISEKTIENSLTISESQRDHLTNYTATYIIFTTGIPTCEDTFLQRNGWLYVCGKCLSVMLCRCFYMELGCFQTIHCLPRHATVLHLKPLDLSTAWPLYFTLCLMISEKMMENSLTISECHLGNLMNYTAT
jgi:hypothetical protein